MTPLFPQEVALSEVKRSQRKQWRLMESQLPNGIRPAVFSNKTLGLPWVTLFLFATWGGECLSFWHLRMIFLTTTSGQTRPNAIVPCLGCVAFVRAFFYNQPRKRFSNWSLKNLRKCSMVGTVPHLQAPSSMSSLSFAKSPLFEPEKLGQQMGAGEETRQPQTSSLRHIIPRVRVLLEVIHCIMYIYISYILLILMGPVIFVPL